MHNQSYDQISLATEAIGAEQAAYLQDGMTVMIESFEEEPLGMQLPDHVTLEVVEADAVVKGQTAASSYKPAVLENAMRTMVPPHIEVGTRVVIATTDCSYVERAKD
jgi:elongation factor P